MIQGLNLVSATPRKSKKISVLLEVEDTDENIRAFSDMYRKKLILATEPDISVQPPDDSFDLLIDIRSRCQQIRDLITNVLEPSLPPSIATLDISNLSDLGVADGAKPLMAVDEIQTTEPQNVGIFEEDQI